MKILKLSSSLSQNPAEVNDVESNLIEKIYERFCDLFWGFGKKLGKKKKFKLYFYFQSMTKMKIKKIDEVQHLFLK